MTTTVIATTIRGKNHEVEVKRSKLLHFRSGGAVFVVDGFVRLVGDTNVEVTKSGLVKLVPQDKLRTKSGRLFLNKTPTTLRSGF